MRKPILYADELSELGYDEIVFVILSADTANFSIMIPGGIKFSLK
eukprot:gene10627-3250_t